VLTVNIASIAYLCVDTMQALLYQGIITSNYKDKTMSLDYKTEEQVIALVQTYADFYIHDKLADQEADYSKRQQLQYKADKLAIKAYDSCKALGINPMLVSPRI